MSIASSESQKSQRSRTFVCLALVIAVAVVPYLQVLGFGFVYDDHLAIEENPHLSLWPGLSRIFFSDIWTLSRLGNQSNYYRPLFLLSYEGVFQIAGSAPWAFHFVNLVFHAATAIMVFLLSRRLWQKDSVALLATFLFALHPTHVEAVAWIAALCELGYTLFVLIALYFYCHERRSKWAVFLSLSSYATALLWKESALAFIPLIVLYDLFVIRQWRWKRWIPAGGVTLAYLGLRSVALGGLAPSVLYPDLSLPTQVLTAISNVAFYLGKLIAPIRLSAFYIPEFVSSVNVGVCVVLLLVALGLWKLRGRTAWAAVWIVAGLFPVLFVSRVAVPLADRDLYLPSIGFAWIVAVTLDAFGRKILVPVAGVLLIGYGFLALQQLPAWRDDLSLFAHELQQQPDSSRIRLLLASELARRGQHEEAMGHLREILSHHPSDMEALIDMSGVQLSMKDSVGVRETCSKVFQLHSEAPRCLYNLGYLDEIEGRFVDARNKFAKAYELDPTLTQALLHQGLMDARMGKLNAAEKALEAAVERIPTASALNNLGSVYAERGEFAKAVRTFEAALRVDPSFELARRNLQQAVADSR